MYGVEYCTHITTDGSTIFYPEKISQSGNYTLYYKSLKKADAEPIKIDSDVCYHTVNDTGTLVTYIKTDGKKLYQYNTKKQDKEKIASEIAAIPIPNAASF